MVLVWVTMAGGFGCSERSGNGESSDFTLLFAPVSFGILGPTLIPFRVKPVSLSSDGSGGVDPTVLPCCAEAAPAP